MKKTIVVFIILIVAILVLIQFLPYGRQHTNPPVIKEPNWDSSQTRALAQRACFDCHSNETIWPWYSNIAPASWLVQKDVDDARSYLNFSEWGQREQEVDEIPEIIINGEMPPFQYLLMHPSARLTASEKEALTQGLISTLGSGE